MVARAAGGLEVAGQGDRWEVTGNHYLAVPFLSRVDGGIHRLNVLHRGALGLLEWASARGVEPAGAPPLLAPELREGDRTLPLDALTWERLERWIPRFRAEPEPGLVVQGTFCAPGGADLLLPGAVYELEIENRSDRERTLEVGLGGTWSWSLRTVESSRPLTAPNRAARAGAPAGLVLELGGEPGLATLGIVASGDGVVCEAATGEDPLRPLEDGEEVASENGRPLRVRIGRTVRIAPGRRATVAFFFGVVVERDGALTRAATLRRYGAAELLRLGRLQLAQMTRPAGDPALGSLLNRNLLFNAFFAVGRAIDDERLYPLVSRSPLTGSSAVFRERDALNWSLPALRLVDPMLAREALLRAFEQFSHRPGAWSHYLDGGALSPAFALDQFCAYAVALERYVRESDDETLLDEPIVGQVLRELDDLLMDRLHPEVLLAATELLPSGDEALHPYVTYDNALVRAFCEALADLWAKTGTGDAADRSNFADAAEEVEAALWRHCTAEVDGLRVLAWSTDLAGEAAVYDDPEGSLSLLPYLGFCEVDDPVWSNTIDLLRSSRNPFWLGEARHPGLGSRRHPELGSLAALCSDLLGPRREAALDILRGLELDDGLACGWYDPDTGRGAAERHHAALAGFVAWTLWIALGGEVAAGGKGGAARG